jgi:hypothetical protein
MWGKRKRRCAQLPRQLSHALLEDAMGRVQQQQETEEGEPDALPYPGAVPPSAAPPDPPDLRTADVPVDNSAGPEPPAAPGGRAPRQRELPAQRTGDSSRHGTFG